MEGVRPRGSDAFADTDVLHNELSITVDPENSSLSGSNTFHIRVTSVSLSEFTFRLADNFEVNGATLTDGTTLEVIRESPTTCVARLDRVYGADEELALIVEYSGIVRSSDTLIFTETGGKPLVFSISQPYYAHTWWPCKDGDVGEAGDNGDKATIAISITAPSDLMSVANGVLVDVDSPTPELTTYHYSTSYELSTYLVCFATGPYVTWSESYESNGVTMPLNFYVPAHLDTESHRADWGRSREMLSVFTGLFGEYPFIEEQYGIYYFTDGGGMEHQTLSGQGSFAEYLTAHELAHQWWGDMVTCRTWRDIWLNEGLASYSEALWMEHHPDGGGPTALRAYMDELRPYEVNGSVIVPDESLGDLGRIFDSSFTYKKPAWVMHQLRHVLGDDGFFEMLASFRANHAYSTADTQDFIAVAESVYGGDLSWFFEPWVYGRGAPCYSYGWAPAEADGQHFVELTLRQAQPEEYGLYTMPIDVDVTTSSGVVRQGIFNNAGQQNFILPVDAEPTAISLDPEGWILHEGLTQEGAYEPAAPVVLATSPRPGDLLRDLEAPVEIVLYFDASVAAEAADFSIVGEQAGSVMFRLEETAAPESVRLILVQPLLEDRYTVTAATTLTSSTTTLALDGELADGNDAASLPSGDGQPGGDLVFHFEVGAGPVNDRTQSVNCGFLGGGLGTIGVMALSLCGSGLLHRRFRIELPSPRS